MIYTCITAENTLLFFENRHQIASINFKSRFKLYKYLKLCLTYIDYGFNDFLDSDYINYNTLTLEDIELINEKYDNMLYEFSEHILNIERG